MIKMDKHVPKHSIICLSRWKQILLMLCCRLLIGRNANILQQFFQLVWEDNALLDINLKVFRRGNEDLRIIWSLDRRDDGINLLKRHILVWLIQICICLVIIIDAVPYKINELWENISFAKSDVLTRPYLMQTHTHTIYMSSAYRLFCCHSSSFWLEIQSL